MLCIPKSGRGRFPPLDGTRNRRSRAGSESAKVTLLTQAGENLMPRNKLYLTSLDFVETAIQHLSGFGSFVEYLSHDLLYELIG